MADWPEPGTEAHEPPEDQRKGLVEAAPFVGLPGTAEDAEHMVGEEQAEAEHEPGGEGD